MQVETSYSLNYHEEILTRSTCSILASLPIEADIWKEHLWQIVPILLTDKQTYFTTLLFQNCIDFQTNSDYVKEVFWKESTYW